MTQQFHEGQEVEVYAPYRFGGAIPMSGDWRKAKIVYYIGSRASNEDQNDYLIQFPNGTRDVFDTEHIRAVCKYGDPFCPSPDGDPCHYEGKNPMRPSEEYPGLAEPDDDTSEPMGKDFTP